MNESMWRSLVITLGSLFLALSLAPDYLGASSSATGTWVLIKVEDGRSDRMEQKPDDSYNATIGYIYQRNNFTIDWQTNWQDRGTEYFNKGRVNASFSNPPERISPGQTIIFSMRLQSIASTNYPDTSAAEDRAMKARIYYSGPVKNDAGQYVYRSEPSLFQIPIYSYGQTFDEQHDVSITLPEKGIPDEKIVMDVGLSESDRFDRLVTTYTYQWEPGVVTAELPQAIELRGVVRSVEDKPMPWMQMQALVFPGQEQYEGSLSYDYFVEGVTDHLGRYALTIPLAAGPAAKQIGILLIGTMTCRHPYRSNQELFTFVDTSDSFSLDHNQVSVSSWLSVKPDELAKPQRPGDPLVIYRKLGYYNLGLGAWSMDEQTMPDPLVPFGEAADYVINQQNFSSLYTAAFDAWFFGGQVLQEETQMIGHPIRIELRWVPKNSDPVDVSYYDGRVNTIRLTARNSLRDDNSRMIILHEFGHAFDFISNGAMAGRAAHGYGPNDKAHVGYFNDTTADSFGEGFATFYAGLVQQFSGYPNPHVLDFIRLTAPSSYKAWGSFGTSEEFAIASLLYFAHPLVGDINQYWQLLRVNNQNFYEYYRDIRAYALSQSQAKAQQLDDYAFESGLFTMPFGNGQYDPGEPFRDLPDANRQMNGIREAHEPYADLMFDADAQGVVRFNKTIRDITNENLQIGAVSDAMRARRTLLEPANSYIWLSGEPVDYLLVTISGDFGETIRTLRDASGGRLYVRLPEKPSTGQVELAVPGGEIVYRGDLSELQQRYQKTFGRAVPLAEATIRSADLAPADTACVATYGSRNATGVLQIPVTEAARWKTMADRVDQTIGIDRVKADLLSRKNPSSAGPVGQTEASITRSAGGSGQRNDGAREHIWSGVGGKLLLGGLAVALVLLILFALGMRKRGRR